MPQACDVTCKGDKIRAGCLANCCNTQRPHFQRTAQHVLMHQGLSFALIAVSQDHIYRLEECIWTCSCSCNVVHHQCCCRCHVLACKVVWVACCCPAAHIEVSVMMQAPTCAAGTARARALSKLRPYRKTFQAIYKKKLCMSKPKGIKQQNHSRPFKRSACSPLQPFCSVCFVLFLAYETQTPV